MSVLEPASVIRVLLADDDPAVLAALTDLLNGEPGVSVVATARDADTAVVLASAHRPDIALVDMIMPGGGARAVHGIRRVSPETRFVALSAHDDRASVAAMLRAGALGYVVKGAPVGEILDAVERASRGLASLSGPAAAAVSSELDEHLGRQELAVERAAVLVEQITGVLEPGSIRAVYQPIFELATLRVVGYEALARFDREPVRGPDVWFAAADEAGLRLELELAAIRAAVARFSELPGPASLALNVSPATAVSEELATLLLGLPAERLVIEITEHAPVADYDALGAGLAGLRSQGVRLSVDDAGAGFASLRHILLLAPDIIKLDISLTRSIEADRARRSMASALIAFATEMGIKVVAEGIETAAELGVLRDLGAGYGQGYLLGRPGEPPGRNGAAGTGPGPGGDVPTRP